MKQTQDSRHIRADRMATSGSRGGLMLLLKGMGIKMRLGFSVLLLIGMWFCSAAQEINADSRATISADSAGKNRALAMKLKNPVADMTLVPMQNNLEFRTGELNATRNTLKFEPVIPVQLSPKWRMITRTILPLVYQDPSGKNAGGQSGIGDLNFSAFLSPNYKINDWVLGAGLVMNLPTASNDLFGFRKWAMGPTAVAVRDMDGYTFGLLLNQQWSFGGPGVEALNAMLIDPWAGYSWNSGFSVDMEFESTADWASGQWTIPLRCGIGQVVNLGPLPVGLTLDGLWYLSRADIDPRWGISFTMNFVIKK